MSYAQQALDRALKGAAFEKRVKRRNAKDTIIKFGISLGGISVILAVLLIMLFFVHIVLPLFGSATVNKSSEYTVPGSAVESTLYYGMDEYQETALRFTESGKLFGFDVASGQLLSEMSLPLNGEKISSFSIVSDIDNILAFGLTDGSVLIAKYGYDVSYPNDKRTITPKVEFPFGEQSIQLGTSAIEKISVKARGSDLVMAFILTDSTAPADATGSKTVAIKQFFKERSMLSERTVLEPGYSGSFLITDPADWLLLDGSMRNLYVISKNGATDYYNISDVQNPVKIQHVNMLKGSEGADNVDGEHLTTVRFLLGDYSLMLGTSQGDVIQWFPVRDQQNEFALHEIRKFSVGSAPIHTIAIEKARKGFATTDAYGQFNLYHSTAERHLNTTQVTQSESELAAGFAVLSNRADGALVETQAGQLVHYLIDNQHPDISFSSLWSKVWYEGYSEPDHVWQSSSASADFEPKFSLTPLTFGTIKAALYSMLFAVPIAVLAAIYTAFFMDKRVRQWIKPSIELIEALPTVILGFLAGLWLAPHMEANLSGFFALLLVMPLGVVAFGFGWSKLPETVRLWVPAGRRAVLMIPVVLFLGWLSMVLNEPIQELVFDGDMRHWLTHSAGIDFDQRNAMVIGFAMGFALIPTIFSVTEDAIYNVPSYLVNGSLALGASGWQTLVGVVIPTASPGIFSAIMLGFGRGVGETMIVLMASGNTPLMEVNLFEGMRTLAANLAVEMPEAAVASSHYRVLFLSGLVLFIFTFVFNTLAEVVRQRMRRKYGNL